MRKIIFLALIICINHTFYSQGKTIDAKKISNYWQLDTTKVEMIIDYCVNNTFSNSYEVYKYANQALEISKKINYKKGKIRALNCIGNYYYQIASYDNAVKFYNEALSIAEKSNDIQSQVIGLSNLASLHTRIHQEVQAIPLFKRADSLLIASKNKYSQNRAAVLTNMGMAFSSLGQHQKSLYYHLKTLEICKLKNISFGIALSKSNIGDEYVRLQQFKTSLPYLLDAMKISEKEGYDNFLSQIYKNLAEVNLSENKTTDAIVNLQKSIKIAKKVNDNNALLSATKLIYTTYFKQKDFRNAFLSSVAFTEVYENINGAEKQKNISDINTKYETEKKEAQIKALSQQKKIANLESERQKTIVSILVFAIILLLFASYFLFNRYKIKKQNELLKSQLTEAEKTIEAEKKAAESELKALKSQMNPHFIFNALSSIQDQFMYGDKVIANEQMGNFAYLTRQILNVSGKKQILLSTEIDILSKYLELEKMRFKKDFEYSVTTSEIIDEDYHEILPMLIQPFVENSIKHGLLHKSGLKQVSIHFDLDQIEEFIICTVIDNGIGRQKSAEIKAKNTTNHESFSTSSIMQRLDIWNTVKTNAIVYEDVVSDENEVIGTKVTLKIELH
jgi:tetratricopeptide (TPR) repeat protein